MTIRVALKPKGKVSKLQPYVELDKNDDAAALLETIARHTGLSKTRIRISTKTPDAAESTGVKKDYVLHPSDSLHKFANNDYLLCYVRDLGPQISWRTVFLLEYLGPLLIHPAFYFGYYGQTEKTLVQKIVFVCIMLHFIKRELETAYVHKFSLATMPLRNLFKNCAHYWLLSGFLVAFFIHAPSEWTNTSDLDAFLYSSNVFQWDNITAFALAGVWAFAEISNGIVHLNLASLRPAGSTERRIPYGYGFDKLSCPNYFFEAWGWSILCVLSMNWSLWVFNAVGSLQMYFWAAKKHKRYLKEFPDYPKDRKAFLPYLA